MFPPHPRVKVSIVGSLRDREVACSASDHQGWNFKSCVWRSVSSQSSRHLREVLLAQFSLYVHKGGIKPDSFHFQSVFPTHHASIFPAKCTRVVKLTARIEAGASFSKWEKWNKTLENFKSSHQERCYCK